MTSPPAAGLTPGRREPTGGGRVTKVLWHVTMSLDGFISGPGDAMDWVFEWPGRNAVAEDVMATTGAIVVGRRTYEVEDRERGGFYGGAWSGPFIVLTHEPPARSRTG
jgi:dihydrofolate reductase